MVLLSQGATPDAAARNAIKETGVDIRYYSIIYEAIDEVKHLMSGLLAPEVKEQIESVGGKYVGIELKEAASAGGGCGARGCAACPGCP